MKCYKCQTQCRCVDSRDRLAYGLLDRPDARLQSAVRERKYICKECSEMFFTREYIIKDGGYATTKDKRLTGGVGNA